MALRKFVDEGQQDLPSNLKELLKPVRNVWKHRAALTHAITGTRDSPPSMAQDIHHFENSFSFILRDSWMVARGAVAGQVVLRGGFPLPRLAGDRERKHPSNKDVVDHCELMMLLQDRQADEQHILRMMYDIKPAELIVLKDETRHAGLLYHAACRNLSSVLHELLSIRLDLDAGDGTRIARIAWWEPALEGNANIMRVLIDAGADVNVCTRSGLSIIYNSTIIHISDVFGQHGLSF